MSIKPITVAQHERALVWKNGAFWRVLEPGVHWLIAPLARLSVETYDLVVPEFEHKRLDFLVKEERATVERCFDIVELALGEDPGPPPSYQPGVVSRWTLGDLDHLLACLRHGPRGHAGVPGRAAALLGFGRAFLGPARSEVLRWSDPHPAAREARLWLRALGASTSR